MKPKVALIIASKGYQQVEYSVTKKVLENNNFTVVTVSDTAGTATAKDNTSAIVDLTLDALKVTDYAGIFFIGGPGSMERLDTEKSYSILRDAKAHFIPRGAICLATRILAHAGILDGLEATGWDGDNELSKIYQEYKVTYAPVAVVTCDYTITATGPSAAEEFGQAIVMLLKTQTN